MTPAVIVTRRFIGRQAQAIKGAVAVFSPMNRTFERAPMVRVANFVAELDDSDSLSMLPPGILKARGYAKGKHPLAPDQRVVVPQPAARCKMRCSRQRIALHRDEVATFQHDQKSKNSRGATSEPVGSLLQGSGKVRNVVDQAKDAPYKDEYCCAVLVNGKFLSKYPEASAAATRAILKAAKWVDANPTAAAVLSVEGRWSCCTSAAVPPTAEPKPT